MKHFIGILIEILLLFYTYFILTINLLFNSIIFGLLIMIINNNILARLYKLPILTYLDSVGILFIIMVITLIIRLINVTEPVNKIIKETQK